MELVEMLTSQLGISKTQAEGGSGLLFKMARDKLGSADFGTIAQAVPGVNDLMASAPKAGGLGGMLGGLASKLGGGAGNLGNLASLAGGFGKLKLDPGMISKFIPIVMSFVQTKGGTAAKDMLARVLK